MSAGFGFSVGDFISALELVADVIDALRESGEASKRYRELVRQLDSLESVLLRVKRLELDEAQYAEYIALQQTSSQCQRTIDEFWKKIKKYQPALGTKGSSRLKENWMRIRWAVCKKEDVNAFKADIAAHTESIHLLLTTIQMSVGRSVAQCFSYGVFLGHVPAYSKRRTTVEICLSLAKFKQDTLSL